MTGGLLVDKPAGMTSHDVVRHVRRALGVRAVGHTGTLDPFATGLLVMVVGSATRLARFVEAADKEYDATARLGQETTTDDATGEPVGVEHRGPWPDRDAVEAALAGLTGRQPQRPPVFSAKRVAGVRSYARARAGESVQLPPVDVEVHRLDLTEYAPPVVRFRAVVGPGAYLRAIARDLGRALATGGHLAELRRVRVGAFDVRDAMVPERIDARTRLLAPGALLAGWRQVPLGPDDVRRVGHGQPVGDAPDEGSMAALVAGSDVVAVARSQAGRWQPVVVLGSDA